MTKWEKIPHPLTHKAADSQCAREGVKVTGDEFKQQLCPRAEGCTHYRAERCPSEAEAISMGGELNTD